ncbi:pol [Penaeus vannamei]|uniref:Pol n=1 Tax=Penaeus vannamei TaxID=6689 RepID=A0A3R7QJS0_PENVA|nr:pol [Penaeus vannamei]
MANNPNAEEKIKLLQWNILGFRAKLPLLTLALAEQRYDVVLLQETLLQTSITIPNYKGFHQFYSQDAPDLPSYLSSQQTRVHTPQRGVLDLSFVSTSLLPLTTWSLHPYLASDHFASTITVDLPRLQRRAPEPRWNFRRADWHEFSYLMEEWAETHVPAHDLEDQEKEIVAALHQAANQAIPKVGTSVFTHKNGWFYNDRVRELKHRLIVLKKKLKQHFSPSLLETFRAAHRLICKEIQEIRTNSWLEWCESLNAHTSLHDLWTKLNRVSGKHKKQPSHPQPLQIANDLIQSFQARSSNTQLPRSTLNRTQNLSHRRELSIHTAIALPSDLDVPFTLYEIKKAIKTSKDTAPGIDKISYSMLNHLGDHALMQITNLFTASLTSGRLPSQWKEANIHPIPKNTTPPSYRPISLQSPLGDSLRRILDTPQAPHRRVLPWHHEIHQSVTSFNLLPALLSRGIDAPHHGYAEPNPWEPPLAAFLINSLPRPKKNCSPNDLQNLRETISSIENDRDTTVIYTDGSVDPESGRAGGAFLCNDYVQASRLSNDSSILQAELFAIRSALTYALFCTKSTVCIFTDSLSAIHTLQNRAHLDNVYLATSTLFKLQQLTQQGKTVRIMWIPSHVGLEGNDRVDSAAKSSLHQTRLQPIKPSISQIKNRAKITAKQITLIQHQVWVQAGSPSATWYKTVTEYETITIPRSMSRKDAVIIHRLRLGYPCSWEIDERVPKECNYCQTVVSHPLTHYLLDCQALYHIRHHNFSDVPNRETSQRSTVAATYARTILDSEESFKTISAAPPPR